MARVCWNWLLPVNQPLPACRCFKPIHGTPLERRLASWAGARFVHKPMLVGGRVDPPAPLTGHLPLLEPAKCRSRRMWTQFSPRWHSACLEAIWLPHKMWSPPNCHFGIETAAAVGLQDAHLWHGNLCSGLARPTCANQNKKCMLFY